MKNGYTFLAASKIGAAACENAITYYRGLGFAVTDVQAVPLFFSLDVDLLVDGYGWVEVKGDTYQTGNFFLEVVRNATRNSDGCMLFTQADYLFYYFLSEGRAFVIPVQPLQAWISTRITAFPVRRAQSLKHNGAELAYESIGHLVPVETLIAELIDDTGRPLIEEITGLPILIAGKAKRNATRMAMER